jgi:hypothetical protein
MKWSIWKSRVNSGLLIGGGHVCTRRALSARGNSPYSLPLEREEEAEMSPGSRHPEPDGTSPRSHCTGDGEGGSHRVPLPLTSSFFST